MVGLATNQHSASIKPLNVTIARRLDLWLQCVTRSDLLTNETRILPVVSVLGLCKKLLTVMMTTVVTDLDTCIIFYRWALEQTSSYSQWISTHPLYQLLQQHTNWGWESEHHKAFDVANQMLSSDRALAHYYYYYY